MEIKIEVTKAFVVSPKKRRYDIVHLQLGKGFLTSEVTKRTTHLVLRTTRGKGKEFVNQVWPDLPVQEAKAENRFYSEEV
ncbi:MAG: hypothetical protein WC551_11925 [Patescibacteria group bacterium]